MTSAVISPETKDTPSLTVSISQLSSSSPFPSPGSPFLPPPIPSAHEYALVTPVPKRSTDSRMNVGSKTDHDSAASTPHNPVTVGKTSSTFDIKRKESADITTNGSSSSGNGLADSFSPTLESGKPDSKATVNGQTTPLLNRTNAELPIANHENALEANLSKRSIPQDADAGADTGGISVSPSTPSHSSPSPHNPPAADPRCSTVPPTTTSLPSISTTTATPTTRDLVKPSPDNNPKSPSRSSSLRAPRDSLTSSRPAPLSPANSRRVSKALSRHSSTSTRSSRSRPGSISSLTPANPTHNPEVASPTTPTPIQQQQQQQQQQPQQQNVTCKTSIFSAVAPPYPILVKIRDFAFPDEDVRHTGTGPLTPRPNRRLQRPLSTWSASSASSAGSEDYRDDGAASGGSSSFGFSGWGLGRLGWLGARSSLGSARGANPNSGDGPSQGDFARNFTDATSPGYEIEDPYDSLDDDDDDLDVDDDVDERGGGNGEADGERPLLPGLYRALYAFEPEGTAEMALEEDQIVRVIGRGGGVGWAIVARDGGEGHALVPEGYLELVSSDKDRVEEEEEG